MEDDLARVAQESARGGFFLFLGASMATFILAITSILVARFLGPELYGQYVLVIVAPELFFLFTDLGLNQAIIKFTATLKSKNEAKRIPSIIKHGMLAKAAIGIAIFAVNYVFAESIAVNLLQRPDLGFYIQLASVAILFRVISTTATSAFVGLDKTEFQAVTRSTEAIVKAISSIALILAGFSIIGAVAGYTISYIGSTFVAIPLVWLLLRQNTTLDKSESFKTNLKNLFQYGSPLYICVLIEGLMPLLNNVILAFFVTDTDIGNFKAAINFAVLLLVLASPITVVLLPAFSKLNHISKKKARNFFQIALRYTTLAVVPVASLIIIFSSEIVQIIYGSTYQLASLFLSTYILLYLLVGIGYLTLPSFFNGLGETRITLKMNLVTLFTLLVLAVPLTQTFGVQGIIAAFIISLMTGTFYGAYTARKKFDINFDIKSTARIYLISAFASVFPLLFINFTSFSSELKLVLGSTIYLLVFITLMPLTSLVFSTELQKITLAARNTPLLKQFVTPIIKYQQKILNLKAKLKERWL